MGRVVKTVAIGGGVVMYIWIAAVREAPAIRARKAARRAVGRS